MKTYNIKIEKPCSQNWDKMTESEKGRFCSQCSRHLVDFSVMTDSELIRAMQNARGKVCGCFGEDQLNRDMRIAVSPSKQPMFYRLMAAFLLLLGGMTKDNSSAQELQTRQSVPGPGDTLVRVGSDGKEDIVIVENSEDNEEADEVEHVFKGKVFYDRDSNILLRRVKITLTGTGMVWRTNVNGEFSIAIPSGMIQKDTLEFEFSKKDYEGVILVIDKNSNSSNLRIPMPKPRVYIMGFRGVSD
jgi:hypothetical protein